MSFRSPSGELDTSGTRSWFSDSSSRNELSQLLYKADQLVKGHSDQSTKQTLSAYNDLRSNSKSLKSKHQELLNRIPGSPRPTPLTSPIISSPMFFTGPLHPSHEVSTVRRRRVSVSPADLSLLSDQNAELLLKIETLEGENTQAERDGRRKVEKLDEEIQYLRAELEHIHAKSDELEERALRGERELKKMEREDRIRELRLNSSQRSESGSHQVQDFAPESALPTPPVRRASSKRSASSSSQVTLFDPDTSQTSPDTSKLPTSTSNLPVSTSKSSPLDTLLESDTEGDLEDSDHHEALVSKLMSKIDELESTNTRILSQQSETVSKWRVMQQESESIARAYDYLDSEDLDIVTEEGSFKDGRIYGEEQHDTDVEVMTFRTFRKSLDLSRIHDRLAEEFNAGIGDTRHSTIRNRTVSTPHQRSMSVRDSNRPNRNRRSVVGLFNEEGRKQASDALRSDFLFPRASDRSASEGYPMEPPSPTLSALSITSPSHASLLQLSSLSQQPMSLESELGRVWPSQDTSRDRHQHHLHSKSILEMLSLPASASSSPAVSEIALPDPLTPSPPRMAASHRRDRTRSFPVAPRTPSPIRDLRISLQPPTPEHSGQLAKIGSADGKRSLRNGRLSQKVRTRADRWELERFPDSPRSRKVSTTQVTESLTLTRALDHVVETLTKVNHTAHASEPATSSAVGTVKEDKDKKGDRFVAMMFEFWLWLQFIIVIVVFLFALARRGPRSVLKDKQT